MFTQTGRIRILEAALRNQTIEFYVGLCTGEYAEALTVAELEEPELGVNGYQRIAVAASPGGWEVDGVINDEIYFETGWLTWAAVGGDFSKPIQRMFLTESPNSLDAPVLALGGAFPEEILIRPVTPEANRKFKFRIYVR